MCRNVGIKFHESLSGLDFQFCIKIQLDIIFPKCSVRIIFQKKIQNSEKKKNMKKFAWKKTKGCYEVRKINIQNFPPSFISLKKGNCN